MWNHSQLEIEGWPSLHQWFMRIWEMLFMETLLTNTKNQTELIFRDCCCHFTGLLMKTRLISVVKFLKTSTQVACLLLDVSKLQNNLGKFHSTNHMEGQAVLWVFWRTLHIVIVTHLILIFSWCMRFKSFVLYYVRILGRTPFLLILKAYWKVYMCREREGGNLQPTDISWKTYYIMIVSIPNVSPPLVCQQRQLQHRICFDYTGRNRSIHRFIDS